MPDLLLELLSEEIPARMQARAADDLRRLVTDALVAEGVLYEGGKAYATPRRLALHVVGLPARGKDVREERRGPRVGAPEAAMAGFLKSAGVMPDQVKVVSDPKKGDFHLATIERPGRPTPEVLSKMLPGVIRTFPWPKSMRWGAASAEPGSLRWVRPLQSVLCTFTSDTEAPEIVPFVVDGITSGDMTRGHRFMAPAPIRVRRFDDYVAALETAKVVLDSERRRDIIRHDSRDLAFAQGLTVVEDDALLEEVAGLVEWPVVLMGSFDKSFLDIPPEVIRATIRANQKCFVLRSSLSREERSSDAEPRPRGGRDLSDVNSGPLADEAGGLANQFLLVANIEASDGGTAIVAGNERVVRARLADAKFFWDTDRGTRLEDRLEKLKSIVFHEKLGTQFERVERIAALSRELAPVTGADPDEAERAARLSKADLVTEMVGEFPELQGVMGGYYAAAQGESPAVAAAIADHYKPLGPSDSAPTDPVALAVALADKLDTLVGFWAIDEKPTGSKDPYALRRAALGVIRLVLENGLRLPMSVAIPAAAAGGLTSATTEDGGILAAFARYRDRQGYGSRPSLLEEASSFADLIRGGLSDGWRRVESTPDQEDKFFSGQRLLEIDGFLSDLSADLLAFFHDRLKVYLRGRGARHDLIDAVLNAAARPGSSVAGEVESGSDRDGGRAGAAPIVGSGGKPPTPDPSPKGGGKGARAAEMHAETTGSGEAGPGKGPGAASLSIADDDLLAVVRRVEALGRFLDTEDGRNLLAATKRAANIVRIEEKKDGHAYDEVPDEGALVQAEERELAGALARASGAASDAVGREDFEGAMRILAELRPIVDGFFDAVTVNDPDPGLRANRLRLLSGLKQATRAVADFSKIEA